MKHLISLALYFGMTLPAIAFDPWVVYDGFAGPGKGKHVVMISGDEEYRSEEALPQLGKILAKHHGFTCTVLFAIDAKDGTINPNVSNIPGLDTLKSADLMIIATRYRDLPDDQMKHIADYVNAGRPVIGMRTATHAFNIKPGKTYSRWSTGNKDWPGGFGQQVLGSDWVDHHGAHGKEGCRGLVAPGQDRHPIVRGIRDGHIFALSDVYAVHLPLPADCEPLVLGQVTQTLDSTSPPVVGKKNDPMMPIAWTKSFMATPGKSARVFTTTMGASQDLASAGLRRLLVNATYWAVGLDDKIPSESNVDVVGEYRPSPFKTNGFKPGIKPSDLAIK